ncbi:hypothetical protein [Brevibacterium sp. VCM10]|uniref:hypothetical protein n=1 Tax=Brevibacterium sp. VCM10 TaxID=1381751 RepID=UPI000472793F|nr:hypothetical protein [Brevibacterium sp. VCM10]
MSDDTEVFCNNCFAGMESDEHHEKCVRPREELRTRIADAISEADNEFPILGDDYGAAPNLTAIADAVIDALGLIMESSMFGGRRDEGAPYAAARVVGKWAKQ